MLSAGSSMVRRLVRDQGKPPAMFYVNQTTVRKALSQDQKRTVIRSRQYDQELS